MTLGKRAQLLGLILMASGLTSKTTATVAVTGQDAATLLNHLMPKFDQDRLIQILEKPTQSITTEDRKQMDRILNYAKTALIDRSNPFA